jgi:DNA polymerase III delta prime subunit
MLDIPQYDPHTPKNVRDIVGNQDVWLPLVEIIRTNTSPNIVLTGPAGCGKSLFIRMAMYHHPILTIDCTANSGLRDVRDNIRGFARGSRTNSGDFRWVILEHADALTADTQAFLRRMMETTAANTRFLFECCDAGAIAEPILSRSTLYTVNRPDDTEVRYELMRRTEYSLADDIIAGIVRSSRGNMRSALLNALTIRWTANSDVCSALDEYEAILRKRPLTKGGEERSWMEWCIDAEAECRLRALDTRELLELGWPNNHHVAYMRQQWSRLGGISTRALFFRCMSGILGAVKQRS